MNTIVTLGAEHSFHDIATRALFGDQQKILRCDSFEEIADIVDVDPRVKGGVIAIENAIVGSFLPNYMLLKNKGLRIQQEFVLPIELSLWVHPNNTEKPLDAILSHAIALRQCSRFLSTVPDIEERAVIDTATAVKQVANNPDAVWGALAGKEAGESLGLVPIQQKLQNRNQAWTRFLFVTKTPIQQTTLPNKASWFFRIIDQPSALYQVFAALQKINIAKIQSVPDFEYENEHGFIIDFEFRDGEEYLNLLKATRPFTQTLQELGTYKQHTHGKN